MAAKILPDQDYLRECFLYDPESGILTWRERPFHHFPNEKTRRWWCTKWAKKEAGHVHTMPNGYVHRMVGIKGKLYYANRIIWKMVTNLHPPVVDHWDGNGLNNKWTNLRAATDLQNAQNKRRTGRRGRTPELKGVSQRGEKWIAQITANKCHVHLGVFDTAEEAHAAYCQAAIRYHGEFANFGHLPRR